MILACEKIRINCLYYDKSIIDLGFRTFFGMRPYKLVPKVAEKIFIACYFRFGGLGTINHGWYHDLVFDEAIFGKNMKFVKLFDFAYLDPRIDDSQS